MFASDDSGIGVVLLNSASRSMTCRWTVFWATTLAFAAPGGWGLSALSVCSFNEFVKHETMRRVMMKALAADCRSPCIRRKR
jgi:hypothetical protein